MILSMVQMSSLVANEYLHSRNSCSSPSLLFKLDLEKAYDRVEMEFLLYMLRRLGFGAKRKGSMECLVSLLLDPFKWLS